MEQRDIELFAGLVSKAIEPIKEKIDSLDEKVDSLDKKFDSLDEKVNSLDEKVNSLDEKVNSLDEKVNGLDEKVDNLDEKVNNLDLEVRGIKLSLENEINPKISIIAEGHSILNRKLDEYISRVMDVQDEREQLMLRLVYLESEIVRVKERLAELTPIA